MDSISTLGRRIQKARDRRGLKQWQLAERAGISVKTVSAIEQDQRLPSLQVFYAIAEVLGADPSRLMGKREMFEKGTEDRGVLGVRNAILPPADLPGLDAGEDGTPAPLEQLEQACLQGWVLYWDGRFGLLAGLLPSLLSSARASEREYGTPACRPLAQAYQLAANLMVHVGDDSTAFTAVARAVRAANRGDDPLQHAVLAATAAWVLQHQGRLAEAERIAAAGAAMIKPAGRAGPPRLCVYGALLLSAAAPAAVAGDADAVAGYMAEAEMTAMHFDRGDRHDYMSNFGLSQLYMQRAYQQTAMAEPAKAVKAAQRVNRDDLLPISWGALHLDVAQSSLRMGRIAAAVGALLEAHAVSAEWARHQSAWNVTALAAVRSARKRSDGVEALRKAAGLT